MILDFAVKVIPQGFGTRVKGQLVVSFMVSCQLSSAASWRSSPALDALNWDHSQVISAVSSANSTSADRNLTVDKAKGQP